MQYFISSLVSTLKEKQCPEIWAKHNDFSFSSGSVRPLSCWLSPVMHLNCFLVVVFLCAFHLPFLLALDRKCCSDTGYFITTQKWDSLVDAFLKTSVIVKFNTNTLKKTPNYPNTYVV